MHLVERCRGCMAPDAGTEFCPACGWQRMAGAASVLHLSPGTVLQNMYLVGRALGQGGFGITYIAWDMQLQRKVAIKEFFPQTLASRIPGGTAVTASGQSQSDFEHGLKGFMNEGRILARFSDHPCVVSVLNLFEANRTGYLVMGYLDGVTLARMLTTSGGRMPFDAAREIMMRVMDGLREVHAQGLLHRDISPDNIYITNQGLVKILDFGAARFEAGERSHSLSVVLKEGFAPEEQYRRSGNQGAWTDIYAAAATLYKCITGMTPPPALDRLHDDTLKSPRELGVAMPAAPEAALKRALAVKAGDRFQSIESFQAALAGTGAPADRVEQDKRQDAPAPRKSGFAKWWIGVLVAIGIVIAAIVVMAQKAEQDRSAELRAEQVREEENARKKKEADDLAQQLAQQQKQKQDQDRQAEGPKNPESGGESYNDRVEKWLIQRQDELGPQGYTVTLVNGCSKSSSISVAARFKAPDDSNKWMTLGWWTLEPNKSLKPNIVSTDGNFYFFAESADIKWDGRDDSESVQAPVVNNGFVHMDGVDIEGKEKRTVNMFHRYYDSPGNHNLQLTCDK
jgi:serine/threonine protein kinase